jgi:ribosomal protein S18 acetylase RimI-like enzyme
VTLTPLVSEAVNRAVESALEASHGSVQRAREAAAEYRRGNWTLYGWFEDSELRGCIGVERQGEGAVIRSLAVVENHRRQRIGRAMVEAVLTQLDVPWVEAETDAEAVDFYRRIGFTTASLGEKYPGVERFRCVRPEFR